MAEVRKKEVTDKYHTDDIKKSMKKKEKKENKNNQKPVKEVKKSSEKKGLWARFRIFCNGVKGEFKKVHWPKKEDMLKYSIATIFFIIFCGIFFYVIDVIFAFIKSLI